MLTSVAMTIDDKTILANITNIIPFIKNVDFEHILNRRVNIL